MCGLIVANAPVKDALEMMSHRGTRSKISTHGDYEYGHVRLPIVGLGTEWDQPVRTGAWTLGFVGELLDFRDFVPDAKSDLELVERTWMNNGPHMGGFGYAAHDGFWSVVGVNNDGEIHAVVDYLNQKPLYYRNDSVTAIGSEPAAVASLSRTTPDEVYLSSVIKWGYCPDVRRTPYREVKKTVPGEWLVLHSEDEPRHTLVDPLHSIYATPGALKIEIEQAVRRRVLSSDVPVSALVSGGLDSAIVWTIAKKMDTKVRPYFADMNDPEDWEAKNKLFAGGSDNPRVVYWEDSPLEKALAWMQEPIDLGSLVPQCAMSQAIADRSGNKEYVCLTGDGADEFFGGYGRAMRYDSQASDVFHELIAWHLPRLDRIMMRNQIEVRSPFLARRVAGIALGLDRSRRINKLILRDLYRDDLPPGLAYQKKRPLRTKTVETNREEHSRLLVDMFRREAWPRLR
jgi:asparagine synthase (glutamine-hydrolysing)